MHKRDTIFCTICKAGAFVALLLMVGIFAQLLIHSADAWKHFGISFLWGIDWDPAMDIYGALPSILGHSDTTQTRALDTHIKRLRKKLGTYAECIATERGVGYAFQPLNSDPGV